MDKTRPAPDVYRQTYTRRCKPLAAVYSSLQRFAARPPRGGYRPPGPQKMPPAHLSLIHI
eukprot:6890916-Alexandrium_andersonii.AAC.1